MKFTTIIALIFLTALAVEAAENQSVTPPEIAAEEAAAYAAGDAYVAKVHATINALKAQVAESADLAAENAALRAQLAQVAQERDAALAKIAQVQADLAKVQADLAVATGRAPTIAAKLGGSADQAVESLAQWEAWAGQPLAAALWFLSGDRLDDVDGQFGAASYHLPRAARLGIPVVFSLPLGRQSKESRDLDSIIAGSMDAVYRRELTALASFRPADPTVPVRLGWEANGDWYGWSHDAAKYVAAFRHVAGLARVISPRLQLIWCVNILSREIADWYPGDQYVDVISLDHYFRGGDPQTEFARARDDQKAGLNRVAAFAREHGKPLTIGEWGAVADSGPWVDLMAAWIKSQPITRHTWWDSNAADTPTKISSGQSGTTGERYRAHFLGG